MAMFEHYIADEGLRILNFTENEDANDMQRVVAKLDIYCSEQTNDLFERFKLRQRKREPNESFDSCVAAQGTSP